MMPDVCLMELARYLVKLMHAPYYWAGWGEVEGFGNRACQANYCDNRNPGSVETCHW